MSRSIPVQAALLSSAMLAGAALAQEEFRDTNAFASCESRFAIIFPGDPVAREATFATAAGTPVPARQFLLERGADRYSVTVVNMPEGPALDEGVIDHAANLLRNRGEVRMQFPVGYIAGVSGRQILVSQPDGRQLRGSVYMHDHRIYITEVSSAVGDTTALQFDQSITIIDDKGVDVDHGGAGNVNRIFTCR